MVPEFFYYPCPQSRKYLSTRKLPFHMMDSPFSDGAASNGQKAILDACSCGDLARLQRLLGDVRIQLGSDDLIHRNVSKLGGPKTHELLTRAVVSKQATIVKYLL
jgi:hypothetical protein